MQSLDLTKLVFDGEFDSAKVTNPIVTEVSINETISPDQAIKEINNLPDYSVLVDRDGGSFNIKHGETMYQFHVKKYNGQPQLVYKPYVTKVTYLLKNRFHVKFHDYLTDEEVEFDCAGFDKTGKYENKELGIAEYNFGFADKQIKTYIVDGEIERKKI